MSVDSAGNFVCGGGLTGGLTGGVVRSMPVWTSDPDSLCQASLAAQQQQMQLQQQQMQQQQMQQQQQQQQQQQAPQDEQKEGNGMAGWLKEMFGQ